MHWFNIQGEGMMENKEIIKKVWDLMSQAYKLTGEMLKQGGIQFEEIMKTALETQETLIDAFENLQRTKLKILVKIINESLDPWQRMQALIQLTFLLGSLYEILGKERAEAILLG
jgi:lipid II:glycine glycyltransferase (peptidoglycan interpeptide bridge formation enzyme)